jgi:chemotaxis protein CheZ
MAHDQAQLDRLAQITRQLHDAVVELGLDRHIRRVAGEIPDARDRLSYVGQMTEAAAHKVLNLVDAATPACERAAGDAKTLGAQLVDAADAAASANPAHADLLRRAASAVDAQGAFALAQAEQLSKIMLAQDFQDLSGQVIKKVIGIISQTESQLLALLMDSDPEHLAALAQADTDTLDGPQVPDKALKQDDVDALLADFDF